MEMMQPEVVTLGECMAVLYPSEPIPLAQAGQLALDIAGAEANLSIGLSRLGHRVRFISRVGNDPFGQRIRSTLAAEGVQTDAIITDEQAPTGVFFREWLPDGLRRVFYYRRFSAASRLAPEHLHRELFEGARLVHLTGITPALSQSCAEAVAYAVELAQEAGALVVFDPNYRAPLWEPEHARAVLLPLLRRADIILMSHEDAAAVLGVEEVEEVRKVAETFRAQVTVLRRAEQGACAFFGSTCISVPAHPVAQVVDPVGAGDGFNAGFLAGWLRGYSLQEALQLGTRVGAAIVAELGDYAGFRGEETPGKSSIEDKERF
uniref:Carbohydrate kinase n=1 Tax=Thermosporothrix sp. COM3 TaxID=2490863 RepID=A0A455SED6_9CHLR|nr:carbohydrate kinase [Thermosporothrix sp. COM3]